MKQKIKPSQVVYQASKSIKDKQLKLQDIFSQSTSEKAIQIYNDPTSHFHSKGPIGQEEQFQEIIFFHQLNAQ